MVPVHELLNKTIGYPALAFQHGQNPGPKDLLKLLHLAPWKHIKGPTLSEKAVSDYGMKMRVEPAVISKGVKIVSCGIVNLPFVVKNLGS